MPIIDRIDLITVTEGFQGPPASLAGNTAGEVPTLRRCTGHCCTCFTLGGALTYEDLQTLARRARQMKKGYHYKKPFKASNGYRFWGSVIDIQIVADMVIMLGFFEYPDNPPPIASKYFEVENVGLNVPYFTCRHFTGNACGIYADRPHVCRDFPGGRVCPYDGCTKESPGKFIPPASKFFLELDEPCEKKAAE